MAEKHKPVTFTNSLGEVISNDPIFLAQQTLARAGMGASDADQSIDGDNPYADLGGKELKALAKERGVDITGLKTLGQVRDALVAADEESADADTSDSADDADDED